MVVVGKGKFYSPQTNGEIELQESHTFRSVGELRGVLRKDRVANGFQIKQKHNNKKSFRVRCKVTGCPWKIVASTHHGGTEFVIRIFVGLHTCERISMNK